MQGPKAYGVADALGLDFVAAMERFELRRSSVAVDDLELDIVVSRSGWSNQGGFEIYLDDPTHAEGLWHAIADAGRPLGIAPANPNPTERIENVLLSYGTDTGYDANPLELGLEDHLDLDGPAFIGRGALRRIRDEGPRRRLRGMVIGGADMAVLAHPVPFVVEGCDVGMLRAGTSSPRFSRNIGLALLTSDCEIGAVGSVRLPDGRREARVVELPFDDSLDE